MNLYKPPQTCSAHWHKQEKSDDSAQPNSAVMVQVEPEYDDKTEKTGVLVPPLQAKIELLKKAVNVDSVYAKV